MYGKYKTRKTRGADIDARSSCKEAHEKGWSSKMDINRVCRMISEPCFLYCQELPNEGEVPMGWTRANIISIHKGENKEDPLNYWPMSLIGIASKPCVRIIRKRFVSILERKQIMIPRQFGFREVIISHTLTWLFTWVIDMLQEREGWFDCINLDLKSLW